MPCKYLFTSRFKCIHLINRSLSLHSTPTYDASHSRPFSTFYGRYSVTTIRGRTNISSHFQTHTFSSITSKTTDSDIEEAKRRAAFRAVEEHFDPNSTYVGIGSGTTIVHVVEAIKERITNKLIRFIPTGYQTRKVIFEAGLTPIAFDLLPEGVTLEVAFDGADEVDEDLNCIKGGGACLFQEKLVAERAKKFVCIADFHKAQSRLLTKYPSIPIEVAPISVPSVLHSLKTLGSPNPKVRTGLAQAEPLKTDQDFFIIDAPFSTLMTKTDIANTEGASDTAKVCTAIGSGKNGKWEVERLSKEIQLITGVLEVGLFCGYNGFDAQDHKSSAGGRGGGQKPVAVYFGMEDGSVHVRMAKER